MAWQYDGERRFTVDVTWHFHRLLSETDMHRLIRIAAALAMLCASAAGTPATAAELTFQLINDTERAMNMKLFSRGESLQQWPSKTKAYSMRPGTEVQQVKITCDEGEKICWGAWIVTQSASGDIVGPGGERRERMTARISYGVGERGVRPCPRCCHVCKDGAHTPAATLRDPLPASK